MSGPAAESVLRDGLRAIRPVLATVFVFAFFTNLLLFAAPLYMLQVYDRVLLSRNEATLVGITAIAALALAVYAALEMLRSRLLVRGGVIFDRAVAGPVFAMVHRATLPGERVVRAELSQLAATVREAGIGAPAVIVIGAVVDVLG